MKELVELYNTAGKDFLNNLFKCYTVVTEKVAGSSISFEKSEHKNNIIFYKGNRETRISKIDRVLMKYYENGINFLEETITPVIDNIPIGWVFCFQYFANNQPSVVSYSNLPQNNLLLTHIQIYNGKKLDRIIEDPRVIKDWGNILNVSYAQPIFSGFLNQEQKNKICDFLDMPKEDHLEIFKTTSLAEYIISTLNPSLDKSYLQKSLSEPIDSLVFKFYKPGETKSISAKIVDPYTINLLKKKGPITRESLKKAPADINEILLLDVESFIEEYGLKPNELISIEPEDRYIELISNLFNNYITSRGSSINNIKIDKAVFAKGPEFELNIDNIENKFTKELIQANPEFSDVYKIILGSFRKKRNVSNIMTPTVVNDFNRIVDEINDIINTKQDGFKTFYDFLNVTKPDDDLFPSESTEELTIKENFNYTNELLN